MDVPFQNRRPTWSDHEEYHVPVLSQAVTEGLITDSLGTYVDATLGGGGHAAAILKVLSSHGRLIGIDRDPEAVEETTRQSLLASDPRFVVLAGNFRDLRLLLKGIHVELVDGILLDLGVSSHQIDAARRGFSHRHPGPLDMRMSPQSELTAAVIVNEWSDADIARTLRDFGEEPEASRLARAIVRARPLSTTGDLAEVIRAHTPARKEIKVLARVFQALRIAVNDELGALEEALETAPAVLREGGRLVVISYHSLEDRRVKRFMRYGNFEGQPVRDLHGNLLAPLRPITRRPIVATEEETSRNPRARSARLRIAERTPLK
jgi:16S rRNA (cytosine1402-N4)-methyltransferase